MGGVGINLKKQQCKDMFEIHADSRTIAIVGSEATFPAFFDYAYMTGNKDGGNVKQQKRVPHLTFFSDFAALLVPRESKVIVPMTWDDDEIVLTTETFTVYKIGDDKTSETFQANGWLVKV